MNKRFQTRIIATVITFVLLLSSFSITFFNADFAKAEGNINDMRVTDPSTIDSWQAFFGDDNNYSTRYTGHVWSDKSVTTNADEFSYAHELAGGNKKVSMNEDDTNNFLVSLSAIASSKAVTGESTSPTNTMIVLDLSSSMYDGSIRNTGTVQTMLNAVNNTISELQKLNEHNKIGVTVYYGGVDRVQSVAPSHTLLLPLDRYTHSSNTFLTITKKSNKLDKVKVNSNVKNSSNKTVSEVSRTVTDVAGTYTQQGILSALQQFMASETRVPLDAETQAGRTITPVMILMSDGEPTAATADFTNINANAGMGNNTVRLRYPNETDFVTQLTASYAKAQMDYHYEESPLFYTLSLGSSISYDVMDPLNTRKNSKFVPSNIISGYWDDLLTDGSCKITVKNSPNGWSDATVTKNYTVTQTTVGNKVFPASKNDMNYVDKAFVAADANDLADEFINILNDIALKSHIYPTLIEKNANLSGYVSFVDKIGKYMTVTDIKGILLGNSWYSGRELSKNFVSGGGELGTFDHPKELGDELVKTVQERLKIDDVTIARTLLGNAYNYGQLSYDEKADQYSNYIGWYADSSSKYLGFWHEGTTTAPEGAAYIMKCYLYLGETDETHHISKSDMMHTIIQHRISIETGEEAMTFAIPAALIPTIEYDVELNENGNLKTLKKGGTTKPIRLLYEVALDDHINEITIQDPNVVAPEYLEANTNPDGSVNFYTNQYEVLSEGQQESDRYGYGKVNTYSYFSPSHQNENYYYQDNAVVYSDNNGTAYTGTNDPDINGTYYRAIVTYKNVNGTISRETVYRRLSTQALKTAFRANDGKWYIPNGNVHVNMDGYTLNKTANNTNTLMGAHVPYIDTNGHNVNDVNHNFVVGYTLGNNGKTTIIPATGIGIAKTVKGTNPNPDETFEFVISCDKETDGQYKTITTDAKGASTEGTIKFTDGKATVNLKAGYGIFITGLTAGNTYRVVEGEEKDFILSYITVEEKTIDENVALNSKTGCHI